MQKIVRNTSKILSAILHPLLLPSYGIGLYMAMLQNHLQTLPEAYIWISILGTIVLTALIPICIIILLWKFGTISSFYIEDARERSLPYIYTLCCFSFWCYFITSIIKLPQVWVCISVSTTIALLLVIIINCKWKISAHLTGMGGLLGGICSIALYYSILPTTLIILILLLSLALMYARIQLNSHTPTQTVGGYLLGILCIFTPNLIMFHV